MNTKNIKELVEVIALNSNGIEDLIVSHNIHQLYDWSKTKSFDGSDMMYLDDLPQYKDDYVRFFVTHTTSDDFPQEVILIRKDIVNIVLDEHCNCDDVLKAEIEWGKTDHQDDEFDFFHEVFGKAFDILSDYIVMENGSTCIDTGRYLTTYINAQDYMREYCSKMTQNQSEQMLKLAKGILEAFELKEKAYKDKDWDEEHGQMLEIKDLAVDLASMICKGAKA